MDLRQISKGVLAGEVTLDELKASVEANQDRYRKPPLLEAAHTKLGREQTQLDFERLVDEYSDWEIRIHELGQHLSQLNRIVYDEIPGERTLLIASIIYTLSQLYEAILPRANGAFVLGYARRQAREYYDAAEMLSQATELFRSGGDRLMEMMALSYQCDSLHQDKQFDETIRCATDLQKRAKFYGFRGHEAVALRDLGMAHAALGRESESLKSLRTAVVIRRSLSGEETSQQSVPSLSAFLNALGIAARTFGRFDEALRAFLENGEIHRREGDSQLEALALSEVGYTYLHSGEVDKAVEYLGGAIPLEEEENGPTSNSHRWKLQLSALSGGATQSFAATESQNAGLSEEERSEQDGRIDGATAYLFAEQALDFALRGNHEKAIQLATRVLRWAIAERDVHCQVVCRNVLGISNDRLGRFKDAISEFQKGIQLADGSGGGTSASLTLRYNLAKVYGKKGELQRAAEVLQAGIAFSQMALTRSESFAFRQQVVSGALPLYELFAFMLSGADALHNHETLLAITDVVRARNMASWARTDAQFEGENTGKDVADQIGDHLQQLRAVEVELDLRHLKGSLTSSKAKVLQDRSEELQGNIESIANECGLKIHSASPKSWEPFAEMENALAVVLTPGTAILALFSIPEGVCPSVFYRDDDGLKTAGSIISWDRNERLTALSQWTGEAGLLRSRSTRQPADGEVGQVKRTRGADDAPEQVLHQFLKLNQERLFTALVPFLQRFRPRRLAIIPHRELALIPYWQLVDLCDSIDDLTIVPSLSLLHICVNRSRDLNGQTIVVPDVTGTLPKTHYELGTIESARTGAVETASSVDQLIELGPESNLLHVAAHGAFNAKNPYHSGYLMDSSESVNELFEQYARLILAGEQAVFQFSDRPEPGSFQLMTVAESMARLSLKNCRLAVLSACECGLSDPHGGGELTGLPTSLLVAGAKSVIAALWPVDDAATAVLMDRFYRNWAGGSGTHPSPAHSLALARRALKQMTRADVYQLLGPNTWLPAGDRPFIHPLYADAFQCYGSW